MRLYKNHELTLAVVDRLETPATNQRIKSAAVDTLLSTANNMVPQYIRIGMVVESLVAKLSWTIGGHQFLAIKLILTQIANIVLVLKAEIHPILIDIKSGL